MKKFSIALFIFLVALAVRLPNSCTRTVNADEHSAALWSTRSYTSLIKNIIAVDNHPPLFYVLTKFNLSFKDIVQSIFNSLYMNEVAEVFCIRILSILSGCAICVLTFFCLLPSAGYFSAAGAGLLCAVSPFHVYYSQEARMYPLVSLLLLVSFYFFIKQPHHFSKKTTVFLILAFYTHYIALFFAAGLAVSYVFIIRTKKSFRHAVIQFIVPAAALIPWIVAVKFGKLDFSKRLTHFVTDTTINLIPQTWVQFFGGISFSDKSPLQLWFIYFILILATFLFFSVKRSFRENITALSMISVQLIFFVASVTTSVFFKAPMYREKYMQVIFPLFIMFLCLSFSSSKFYRPVLICFFMIFLSLTLIMHLQANRSFNDVRKYLQLKHDENDLYIVSNYAGDNYGMLFLKLTPFLDLIPFYSQSVYELNALHNTSEVNHLIETQFLKNRDEYAARILDQAMRHNRIWLISYSAEQGQLTPTTIAEEALARNFHRNAELWFVSNEKMTRTGGVILRKYEKQSVSQKFFNVKYYTENYPEYIFYLSSTVKILVLMTLLFCTAGFILSPASDGK